ncbi:hypothetical protein HYS94_04460 [Candidatus Daviesbacteria bacterium]|nr:hypothetical protein [Candidatus Daviesbacteria bacterium]
MKKDLILVLGIILLALLLFKKPLSPTNTISDLEPSPDAIHYLNPLVSLLNGQGLVLSYQDRVIPTAVPPFYTLTLLPLYLLSGEIRFFYITNVILTIFSTILFYKITTFLFKNRVIIAILLLGYVTNYVVYWYPQNAMAENLLLPLYLFSIWLLLQSLTPKIILLSSISAVAFLATKYVAWILALSLMIMLVIKIYFNKNSGPQKISSVLLSILSFLSFFMIFLYIEYLNKGNGLFYAVQNYLQEFLTLLPSYENTNHPPLLTSDSFSQTNFKSALTRYIAGILGGPISVAGKDFIILPVVVGISSSLAIFANLFIKKYRILSLYFLISVIGTLLFVTTFFVLDPNYFYIVDGRYLFVFIPTFLLIFGIFLETITVFLNNLDRKIYSYLILIFVLISTVVNVYQPVVNQLKINFFIPEHPLNFETVSVMNAYTDQLPANAKPTIISILSPFYIDFFTNKKYELLPLSPSQYFTDQVDKVWGIDPNIKLLDIYKSYLRENRLLLVSSYKTNNKYWYSLDMQKIKDNFTLKLVAEGCQGECNLYKVEF